MPQNHRNRSWRAKWITDPAARTATHKCGAVARIAVNTPTSSAPQISLENLGSIDTARWNVAKLSKQANKLSLEGAY